MNLARELALKVFSDRVFEAASQARRLTGRYPTRLYLGKVQDRALHQAAVDLERQGLFVPTVHRDRRQLCGMDVYVVDADSHLEAA